jgi:hypothetical protein
MRRKRLRLCPFVAVGAVALGLLAVAVLTRPRPGVTEENYGRITYGMTLTEVQGLLGGEAEEWTPMGSALIGTWRGDGLTVYVSFQDGRVWQRARMKDGQGWSEMPPEPFPGRLVHRLPYYDRLRSLLP